MAKKDKKKGASDKPKKEKLWSRVFEDDDFFEDDLDEIDDSDDEDDEDEKTPVKKKKKKTGAADPTVKKKKATAKSGEKKAPVEKIDLFDDDEDEETDAPDLLSDEDATELDELDLESAEGLTWDDGVKIVDEQLIKEGAESLEKKKAKKAEADRQAAAEKAETIRLFEQENADEAEKKTRTTLVKTPNGGTMRVHINATETIRNVENAKKQQREREAQRQHEEFLEKQERKKKRQKSAKQMLANTFFAIALTIAVLTAGYYVFLLNDVTVYGNDTYASDYIVEISGLKLGEHLLFCDLDAAKENIQENPYLQVDDITYGFPNRIAIRITERKEVAGIIGLDYNVIIDKNGYVLSMSGGTDLSGLLQVTGVSMSGFQLGQRLGEGGDFGTATLIEMIDVLGRYGMLSSIKSIDLTTPLAVKMTASNGLTVHVGQPVDLENKMQSLSVLLPRFITQGITDGTLYLSAKGGSVYSPSNAAERALAAANGQVTQDTTTGDGTQAPILDENGNPIVTPVPDGGDGTTPGDGTSGTTNSPIPATPTPSPTPYGGGDDFQG